MKWIQKAVFLVLLFIGGSFVLSGCCQIAVTRAEYESTYDQYRGRYHLRRAQVLTGGRVPVYMDDLMKTLAESFDKRCLAALQEVRIALAHPDGLSEQGLMDAKALEIIILNKLFRFNAIERNGIAMSTDALAYYREAKVLCERYENEYHNQKYLTILLEIQDKNGFIWEALDTVTRIERAGTRDPHIYERKGQLLTRLRLEEEAAIAFERWIDLQGQAVHRRPPPNHCLTEELYRLKRIYGHPVNLPKAWIKKQKGVGDGFVGREKY